MSNTIELGDNYKIHVPAGDTSLQFLQSDMEVISIKNDRVFIETPLQLANYTLGNVPTADIGTTILAAIDDRLYVIGDNGVETPVNSLTGPTGPMGPVVSTDYGEMLRDVGSVGPLSDSGFVGWKNANAGILNNVSFNDNVIADNLEIITSGAWLITVNMAGIATSNSVITAQVFIDDIGNDGLIVEKSFSASIVDTMSIIGIVSLTAGQKLDLRMKVNTGGPVFNISIINFTVQRMTSGLQGPTGDIGPEGMKGATGVQGTQGFSTNTGATGPDGATGAPGSTLQIFDAYLDTTSNVFTTAIITPLINNITENSGEFVLSGGQITINETNKFFITGKCTATITSGTRTIVRVWFEINTGGVFTEITGTDAFIYLRVVSNNSTTVSIPLIIDVTSGNTIRLRVQQETPGTSNISLLGNASSISIQNIGGPVGAVGTNGQQGPPGDIGPTGVKGIDGSATMTGATGPTGIIGPTGPQGTQGTPGFSTNTGVTGPKGNDASQSRAFEAVVATSGGDFTSIVAAFNSGAISVFVRIGTFVETANIIIPSQGSLVGESADGTIIDFGSNNVGIMIEPSTIRTSTAGTLTILNGGNTITGIGTSFDTDLLVGDFIKLHNQFYKISVITSELVMIIDEDFLSNSLSGAPVLGYSMIEGFEIRNISIINSSSPGVTLNQAINGSITSSNISNSEPNVIMTSSSNISLVGNYIKYGVSVGGASVTDSVGIKFLDCNIINNSVNGLVINGLSEEIIVTGCTISNNGTNGISILGSSNDIILTDSFFGSNTILGAEVGNNTASVGNVIVNGCIFTNNGSHGIDYDCDNCTMNNNLLTGNGGHGIQGGNAGTIIGNKILSNTLNGLNLEVDDCTAQNNVILDNTLIGIFMSGDRTTASNNIVRGNTPGIVSSGTNNMISNNIVSNSIGIGIDINGADSVINGNNVTTSSGIGINIQAGSTDAVVTGNTSLNNTGIGIVDSGPSSLIKNNKGFSDTYGEMYITPGDTLIVINAIGTDFIIGPTIAGQLSQFTHLTNTITYTGQTRFFYVAGTISAERDASTNADFEFSIYVNEVRQENTVCRLRLTQNNAASSSIGIIQLSDGDALTLRVRNIINDSNIDISTMNLSTFPIS